MLEEEFRPYSKVRMFIFSIVLGLIILSPFFLLFYFKVNLL